MKIIYQAPEKAVSVINPAPEFEDRMEELAQITVPKGLKYKIVADSIIPTDLTFRDAWEVDELKLTDGVGA
jgi:hypothetical protein